MSIEPLDHAANVDWADVPHAPASAARIASLVPSLTELLFALELGQQVVARTGFCVHPSPPVRQVPKIDRRDLPICFMRVEIKILKGATDFNDCVRQICFR